MKKKLLYFLSFIGIVGAVTSCADPEYVLPTADRQSITSVTVSFTEGAYADKVLTTWNVSDPDITDVNVPIPWFYPEESDDETTQYMGKLRVTLAIGDNCLVQPGVTILDMNKDNYFTFTDQSGKSRQINIHGTRTKSSACILKAVTVTAGGEDISGVIDEATKTVTLVTASDLSSSMVTPVVSAHATTKEDITKPIDLEKEGASLTVVAHDGTECAYKFVKGSLPKVAQGIRANSAAGLFSVDLQVAGFSNLSSHPSIAVCGKYLVVNFADGTTPTYFNRSTGSKLGTINLGAADASGCVTSDSKGNMLIMNYTTDKKLLNIYKTNDVTKAPELLISTDDYNAYWHIGARAHVQGDLNGDALITLTCSNLYSDQTYLFVVKNGVIDTVSIPWTMGGVTQCNDDFDVKAVSRGIDYKNDGFFWSHYMGGGPQIQYTLGAGSSLAAYLDANSNGTGWGYTYESMDCRDFNGSKYLVSIGASYFNYFGPELYVYDVTSMSKFSGTVDSSSALVTYQGLDNNGVGGNQLSDVVMCESSDGYKLQVYWITNMGGFLGGMEYDCIDK